MQLVGRGELAGTDVEETTEREMVLAICTKPREEEFLERRHIDY